MNHLPRESPESKSGNDPPMPSTIPYRPQPDTAGSEPASRDEALGKYLDLYIEAIQAHMEHPQTTSDHDPELEQLQQAADQVHQLDQLLAAPVPLPRIGKYCISEILGEGGQAVTYKAWDPDLKRHVVIKLYHAVQTPEDREMVLKEGQALARVRSPYVAQCYGVERHESMPYLVVEYIPGQGLTELHRARPLTSAQALELIAQAAEGLAAVHACGLLHRDLKPGNILVGDDGVPRLVDFGLAMPLGDQALQHLSGTLAYMPPEQARGEIDRIDPRTDLFGLGAVLYYLLTGGPPHAAKDRDERWQAARAGEVVPARQRNPKLPAAVNDLCMRCLAKDPSGRFASATELIQAIRRLQRRRRRLPWLVSTAAALIVLTATALWLGLSQRPSVTEITRRPDGTALRQDFQINVELINSQKDPAGPLYHIAEGKLLSFRVEAQHDCWLGIWYENDEGKMVQLFPNDWESNHLVVAGKPRLIPGENTEYGIRAKPSKGPERIYVMASTEQWTPPAGKKLGPYVVFASPEEQREALRDFELEAKSKAVSEKIIPIQVDPK
jgi:serine/threonine protein kinase